MLPSITVTTRLRLLPSYPPGPRHTALACGLIFLCSWAIFLIGIETPLKWNFDEFHYIPLAKKILANEQDHLGQHPPLGTLMMALGVYLCGDNPLGWRFMSTVFGAFTLVGMYVWALVLFEDVALALWTCALTLVNALLYVQARIGMLDTFMVAFLVWALAAFTAAWRKGVPMRRRRGLLYAFGAFVGLATACKWFGVVALVACAGAVVVCQLLSHWGMRMEPASDDDWYHPGLLEGVRWYDWVGAFLLTPILVYGGIFVSYLTTMHPPKGLADFIDTQLTMYDEQLRVTQKHPYMSDWKSWPWLGRPNWYAFDADPDVPKITRGVLMIGNPWVMWGGMAALGVCVWRWVAQRRRDAFLVVFFYAAFYLCWSAIPRHVAFYYYYYPAGMVLSLAWACALRPHPRLRWGALCVAIGMFCYFLPILSGMPIDSNAFSRWMWFRSWI